MSKKNNLSLYDIATEFQALYELIELDGGELSEEHEALEGACRDLLAKKTDGVVSVYNKLDDDIELADKHIKRLQEFKKFRARAKERLTEWVAMNMKLMGRDHIEGSLYSIKFRKPSKVVNILDKEKVPANFTEIVQEIKIKKSEIAKALKGGEEVDGAELVNGKASLSFKEKSVK